MCGGEGRARMSAQHLFQSAAEINVLEWFSDKMTIHMGHTSVFSSSEWVKTDKPHRDQQMEKR